MRTGLNPVAELQFTKTILWLWDQYEGPDEDGRGAIREFVGVVYNYDQPNGPFQNLFDLYDYVGGKTGFTHHYDDTSPETLVGRPAFERDIKAAYGENSMEMTVADQLHFVDFCYQLMDIGWSWIYMLEGINTILVLLDAKVPKRSQEVADLINRVRNRLQVLDEDEAWNKEHNHMKSEYSDSLEDRFIEEFYSEIILPRYYEVDWQTIRWDKHIKVGQDAIAHYFISRGRSFILLTAVHDSHVDFTPSPMYELVKYHDREYVELRFDDGMYIPDIIGTYRLYAERLASSFQQLPS